MNLKNFCNTFDLCNTNLTLGSQNISCLDCAYCCNWYLNFRVTCWSECGVFWGGSIPEDNSTRFNILSWNRHPQYLQVRYRVFFWGGGFLTTGIRFQGYLPRSLIHCIVPIHAMPSLLLPLKQSMAPDCKRRKIFVATPLTRSPWLDVSDGRKCWHIEYHVNS